MSAGRYETSKRRWLQSLFLRFPLLYRSRSFPSTSNRQVWHSFPAGSVLFSCFPRRVQLLFRVCEHEPRSGRNFTLSASLHYFAFVYVAKYRQLEYKFLLESETRSRSRRNPETRDRARATWLVQSSVNPD
jgi:hypothetical protein